MLRMRIAGWRLSSLFWQAQPSSASRNPFALARTPSVSSPSTLIRGFSSNAIAPGHERYPPGDPSKRAFASFVLRHNHFGLFAPLGSEQAAAQHQGSARFYRGEKRPSTTPDRNRNIRDHKRRLLAAKYELRRNLYKALCRDPELPSTMRVKHRCKLSKLPRNSSFVRVRNRCIFSGRSRGVYKKFRMSRIVFRTLANQGQLMGVKKASW